jgi:hypothetical protein
MYILYVYPAFTFLNSLMTNCYATASPSWVGVEGEESSAVIERKREMTNCSGAVPFLNGGMG